MTFRLCCAIILAASAPAFAGDVIFADVLNFTDPDGNSIRRIHDDGTGLQTLINTGGGVRGVDVDQAHNYIYWTDTDNFVIRPAHFDGSGQQDLINSGLAFPAALRLSPASGKFYWGDASNDEIRRANLDGTTPEFVGSTPFHRGLALDNVNSKIYWTTSITPSTGRIMKSNLDGSSPQVVVSSPAASFKPGNLALDLTGGKIYWTDQILNSVRRSNLDGTNIQDLLVTALGSPKGITLDLAGGKVYWGQDIDNEGSVTGQIYKANLDGSGRQLIADNLGSVNDLVFVVPAPGSAVLLLAAAGFAQ